MAGRLGNLWSTSRQMNVRFSLNIGPVFAAMTIHGAEILRPLH
jgi:hypothetical protein